MGTRFERYELRTTDVAAARAFYGDVLGAGFWGAGVQLSLLPARVVALGVPPNWLGHLGVADVEGTAQLLTAAGGQQLGPVQQDDEGGRHVILRDPLGAVVALRPASSAPPPAAVTWHLLNVTEHERAFALYAPLFGWRAAGTVDLGPAGQHRLFAWDDTGPSVGSIANTARDPRIHRHWLFHFPVTDLTAALHRVRERGGTAVDPVSTATGDVAAACEDAQGAAFGLYQRG